MGMTLHADNKWPALQNLHEKWGVPLDDLEVLSNCKPWKFRAKVRNKGWRLGLSPRAMLARITKAAERLLDRFDDAAAPDYDEKQARALTAMAKTLETISAIGERLEKDHGRNNDRKRRTDKDGRGGASALEAEMAELVKALS